MEVNEVVEVQEEQKFDEAKANKAVEERKVALANQVLTWGILGLAFAFTFCYVGIPFSRKGLRLADEFNNTYGETDARAKVGRILAKVGSIVSLVMAFIYPIYLAYWSCMVFLGGF